MPGINDLFNNPRIRKFLLKLRVPIALICVGLLLLFISPKWFWMGLVISVIGMLLQLWVFACIKTREELAVNGLYMFVRNPMYLARFLLIGGILLFLGTPWILLIYIPLYYLYMSNRVKREEPVLIEAFGDDYKRYCEHVPRFVPRVTPYDRGKFVFFSWKNFHRQHGWTNFGVLVIFYILCYWAAFH